MRHLRRMRAPEGTLKGLTVIGIVANPKTNEPCLAVTDGDYVSLRSLVHERSLLRLGRGYFDDYKNEPYDITGLPRCHTPDGVAEKGKGWGTCLYTALSLGAYLNNTDGLKLSMFGSGDGCSSWEEDRSAAASAWWEQAVRLGLAEQETSEGESETEENVELDLSPSDLADYVDDGTVVYVNKVSVDVERTTETTADYYAFSSAERSHLVAARMMIELDLAEGADADKSLGELYRVVESNSELILDVDPIAISAFDVSALGKGAMNLISLCAHMADVDQAVIDDMWHRNGRGIDPAYWRGMSETHGAGIVLDARAEADWERLADLP